MKPTIYKPQVIFEIGKRENQEDYIYPLPDKASADEDTFILCDGMGGHEKGEVASRTVCTQLSNYIKSHTNQNADFTKDDFNKALNQAYSYLNKLDTDSSEKKMGTTLTFVKLHKNGCFTAHIGDSRIYLIRPDKKQIIHVTRDHSLVYDLYELGEITKEQIKTHPQRNVITRVIMPNQARPSKADCFNIENIRTDDYIFMCSDGMVETMTDEELLDIICNPTLSDEQKKDQLLKKTINNKDNHSAILLHIANSENYTNSTNKIKKRNKTYIVIIALIAILCAILFYYFSQN